MYFLELLGEVLFFTPNNFWQSLKTYFFSLYFFDTLRYGRANWPKPQKYMAVSKNFKTIPLSPSGWATGPKCKKNYI